MIQTDPFRDLDTLSAAVGPTCQRVGVMPMDAFRHGSDVWVHIDLPGVRPTASTSPSNATCLDDRRRTELGTSRRRPGVLWRTVPRSFRRQIELGDGLDLEHLEADLHDGVLTVRIPVASRPSHARWRSDGAPRPIPLRRRPSTPLDQTRSARGHVHDAPAGARVHNHPIGEDSHPHPRGGRRASLHTLQLADGRPTLSEGP